MTVARAALTKPESYGWVHALAGAYVVVVGGFAVSAWLDDGEAFRATMCAGAQVLAIVCAILARRAYTGAMPMVGHLMVVFTLGCSYWSALGIQHAWEANGQTADTLMVGFLAALEPLLFLAAEHIKEGRDALREQFRRDEAEQAAALEAARARDAMMGGRPGPRLVAGTSLLATGAAQADAATFAGVTESATGAPGAYVSTNMGYASPRDHALALKMADPYLSEKRAAAIVGAAKSTVGSWWRQAGINRMVAA